MNQEGQRNKRNSRRRGAGKRQLPAVLPLKQPCERVTEGSREGGRGRAGGLRAAAVSLHSPLKFFVGFFFHVCDGELPAVPLGHGLI